MLLHLLSTALSLYVAGTTSYPSHNGDSQIVWSACDPSVANDTSLSCGFLDVPLDYHDPSVGNARLAIIKANATGERRGSVLFNPGGPGDSGISQLVIMKDYLLATTGGVYDIVSWDPRGVGSLTVPGEVICFDTIEDYMTFFNGTIDDNGIEQTANFTDPADVNALLAQAPIVQKKYEEVFKRCLDSPSGKYFKYIGTAATVRDMVSIADVLDGPDAPINYYGVSYGTLIGSWFVNMFPERVGKVIINGVVNPVTFATEKPSVHFLHEIEDSDAVYKSLITGCALAGPSECPAASEGDGPLDVDAKFQAILKIAHDAAIANKSVPSTVGLPITMGFPLTSGLIRLELFNELYTTTDWARFMKEDYTQIVDALKGGEAQGNTSLVRRSEELIRRTPLLKRDASTVTYPFSIHAITCGDAIDLQVEADTMEEQFKEIIDNVRNKSHMFGSFWPAQEYLCPYWPVRAVERYQGPFNKKLANKIIVASNVYDPITSLSGAQEVARQLGESAVLIVQNGFGHSTLFEPSTCTNNLFTAYMVNGTIPANNTLCEVDADFEIFSGVTTADILAHLPSSDV